MKPSLPAALALCAILGASPALAGGAVATTPPVPPAANQPVPAATGLTILLFVLVALGLGMDHGEGAAAGR